MSVLGGSRLYRFLIVASFILSFPGFLLAQPVSRLNESHAGSSCQIESENNVLVSQCEGVYVGGLCSGEFYKDIKFANPFSKPPHVLVTVALASSQGGCVGSATDRLECYPSNITNSGFRLWCSGSPEASACGAAYDDYASLASANWIAISARKECGVQSGHGVHSTNCSGTNVGGLCTASVKASVSFPEAYGTAPHLLVAAEKASAQKGCVDDNTDAMRCYPSSSGASGFTAICESSPYSSIAKNNCGQFEGLTSWAKFGWLSIKPPSSCQVESKHLVDANECLGTLTASGLCDAAFSKQVTFADPFDKPPHVIVSLENTSSSPSCAGSATDQFRCYAQNVTKTGFQAICSGSPIAGFCGPSFLVEGYTSQAKFGYLAISRDCRE